MRCPVCDKPSFPRRPMAPKDRTIARRQLPFLWGPKLGAHLPADHGLVPPWVSAVHVVHVYAHAHQKFKAGREHDHAEQ